jgi:hypothetical protein
MKYGPIESGGPRSAGATSASSGRGGTKEQRAAEPEFVQPKRRPRALDSDAGVFMRTPHELLLPL